MIRTFHETDLFRPFQDPDDHWDLACQFALAARGAIDLAGVLIDSPPSFAPGDPDVQAVAQLNAITGLSVPCGVGAPEKGGVQLLLRALLDGPLTLHIVGSCHDVACAIKERPDLFEKNCRAIYLNAGSGLQNDFVEYNVELDPQSYGAIFAAPCPVYWMPCFHSVPAWGKEDMTVGRYGTFYRFGQAQVLERLSPRMQSFFVSVLTRDTDSRFLRTLNAPVDADKLKEVGALPRNMWCTAGFFHAVGYAVDLQGEIVALDKHRDAHVFDFTPIDVRCDAHGRVQWQERPAKGADRFVFTVRDEAAYPGAMVRAMATLLQGLG